VRTVHANGRVGSVLPTRVVQDEDDLVALYLAPGTRCKRRTGERGGPRGPLLIEDSGGHEEWTRSESRRLFLWRPHDMPAVSLFWQERENVFLGWYVDILLPFLRADKGFDTRDLDLDIVIAPDRTWHWKDEDELAWSQEQGLRTAQEVCGPFGKGPSEWSGYLRPAIQSLLRAGRVGGPTRGGRSPRSPRDGIALTRGR